jgi:hypothetical protein
MSVEATLYFGYDLGGPEGEGWKVEEADDFGDLNSPWTVAAEQDDGDYLTAMLVELCRSRDLEVAELSITGISDLVAEHFGVQIIPTRYPTAVSYGIGLASACFSADDWTPKEISLPGGNLDASSLHDALEVLGVVPLQMEASWILAPTEY